MQNRRQFLGTAIAGSVPIGVAGYPLTMLAQRPSDEDAPIIAELQRQAKAGVKAMRNRPGEGVRHVASALRVLAAHGRARQLDQQIAQRLRAVIRVHGKEAILLHDLDPAMVNAEMREFGIARPYTPRAVDYKQREETLNVLLNGGFTATLTRCAEALDAQSKQLDRDGVSTLTVRHNLGICLVLEMQLIQAENMMLIFCNPIFSGVYSATCVFWASFAATTWAQLQWYGC